MLAAGQKAAIAKERESIQPEGCRPQRARRRWITLHSASGLPNVDERADGSARPSESLREADASGIVNETLQKLPAPSEAKWQLEGAGQQDQECASHPNSKFATESSDGSPMACVSTHQAGMVAPGSCGSSSNASISTHQTSIAVSVNSHVSLMAGASSQQSSMVASEISEGFWVARAPSRQSDTSAAESSERSHMAGATSTQSDRWASEMSRKPLAASALPRHSDVQVSESGSKASSLESASDTSPTASAAVHQSGMGAQGISESLSVASVCAHRSASSPAREFGKFFAVHLSPSSIVMDALRGPLCSYPRDLDAPGSPKAGLTGSVAICVSDAAPPKKFKRLKKPLLADFSRPTVLDVVVDNAVSNASVQAARNSNEEKSVVEGNAVPNASVQAARSSNEEKSVVIDNASVQAARSSNEKSVVIDNAFPNASVLTARSSNGEKSVVIDNAAPNASVQTARSSNEEKSNQLEMSPAPCAQTAWSSLKDSATKLRAKQARRHVVRKKRRIQLRSVISLHDFNKRVAELCSWTRRRGHLPWARSFDLQEKSLALWVKRICTFKTVQLLSRAQQNQLDTVPGWSWKHYGGKDLRGKKAPRHDDARKARASAEQQEVQRKARENEMKEQWTQLAQQRLALHLARAAQPEARRVLLRQWRRAFHPDKNPGREDKVRPLFEWVQILWKRQ